MNNEADFLFIFLGSTRVCLVLRKTNFEIVWSSLWCSSVYNRSLDGYYNAREGLVRLHVSEEHEASEFSSATLRSYTPCQFNTNDSSKHGSVTK